MTTKETLTIPIHSDFLTDKVEGGLTIRMMIAISAMNGLLIGSVNLSYEDIVRKSFELADDMIEHDNNSRGGQL